LRALLLACTLCCGLSGCEAGYFLQAAAGQSAVLARTRPIDRVIVDARTAPALRDRLELMREARNFASQQLALPDNRSYRSYAQLDRDFVVWNVIAAPEFSTQPRRWCFPVAGCVSYRGYFHRSAAERYARRLRQRGDDVAIGGVPAYSTLGHFADPLLSTMLRYDDVAVIGTIFHELAHQLLYVPDDSTFNESFATTVELAGLRRWLRARGQPQDLQQWQRDHAREIEQRQRIAEARADLAALYRLRITPEAMRQRKQQRLARLSEILQQLAPAAATTVPPRRALNNADLAIDATYWDCVPAFEAELAAVDVDLPRFYRRVRELAATARAQRDTRICGGPVAASRD
jgi:predicted aminopeptidase